jgi:putative membrane protein
MQIQRLMVLTVTCGGLLLGQGGINPNPAPDPAKDQRPPAEQQANPADPANSSLATMSAQDKEWIINTVKDGELEIAMGNLAQQKSSNNSIKSLAQKLVADHTSSNQQLEALGRKSGVALAAGGGAQPNPALSNLTGADFDRTWINEIVASHQKAISSFEQQMRNTRDNDLSSFINTTLPTLRAHLNDAQSVQKSLGVGE